MRSPVALLAIVAGSLMIGASSAPAKPAIPSEGTCHAVVLFARFSNEDPEQMSLPSYAQKLFDPDLPGSLTHFYNGCSPLESQRSIA